MNIDPTYTAVGSLFSNRPMFFIPKYQRAYAWKTGEGEPIHDFAEDLTQAFNNRIEKKEINHFFGGILSVKHSVSGVVNQHEYEIIDGQQRIATFNILASCLIKKYNEVLIEAQEGNLKIIEKRIENLTSSFISFEQEVNRKFQDVDVLTLSEADKIFFKELLSGNHLNPTRDSHENLRNAYNYLLKLIDKLIIGSDDEKIDKLEIIQDIINNDFTILHMVTENKEDAYRLFQVLNDRGTSLTDGDLLRAKTLELVENFKSEQDSIVITWDEVLKDKPSKTESYLNWIHESITGKRANKNNLFDMFTKSFHLDKVAKSKSDAIKIRETIKNINTNVEKCRKLEDGEWLYDEKQPVNGWDRSRLNLLLIELKHITAIPLLLAASELDHKKFSNIVQMLERVFFRYKLICNQHANGLKKIYIEEILLIRKSPEHYNVSSLRSKLKSLIDERADDKRFGTLLSELEYKSKGQSNKVLKYFLLTIEYYYQWYKNKENEKGKKKYTPECKDKSRLYDFSGTSIEHIYPHNAPEDKKMRKLSS